MKKTGLSNNMQKKEGTVKSRLALRGGGYSLVISAVVLAILLAVNLLVSVLPDNLTRYDISAAKLYSITSNTKVVLNALDKDVNIYWIVQAEKEDEILENLLGKYESLSEHVKVVKKNPDVYPTFAAQYTQEEVPNNSLVVECGEKSRFISFNDIYLTEPDMASYSYSASFDGEGAITSAIDYVVNEEQPQLYLLEGHGEAQLPEKVQEQIEKENIETKTFSLLNVDAVPEEADCVMIYAPTSDISPEEKEMLSAYTKGGGKLLVMAGPTEEGTLENLYSLLTEYGVEVQDGIVVEEDRAYYAFRAPYVLLPRIAENPITAPLLEENYYAIVPIAQGMQVPAGSANVTPLLSASATSFAKKEGYQLTTYEKEEGDAAGPFEVALSVDCGSDGQIVWISSSNFLDEVYNAYSSGANLEFTMNALSSMVGENEAVAIRSKSLDYNYLTISDSASAVLKTLMIGVFPLVYLGVGIVVAVRRKRRCDQ